jgi:mannose-6-phosphate isomerase-like protein (cupin superfamily)
MADKLQKVNIVKVAKGLTPLWIPHEIARFNDSVVRLVKIKGEFRWHLHQHDDEIFYVISGEVVIQTKAGDIRLGPNELVCVPHRTLHCPRADAEAVIMLIEPAHTNRLGD